METVMGEDLIEQELPPRPRRRLLNPLPIALLCVLLTACGFIGGVLVEKGQSSPASSNPAGGRSSLIAARLSSLGGSANRPSGTGATVGQVAYTSGHALYVTDAEGNTVKVTTSAASTVTKTVKSDLKAIHPGEMVIVTGGANSEGTVKADSVRVSETGAGGTLSALIGGGGLAGRARAGGGGEGPVLFGK
ncbi:MAG: hypothetical protein ACRDK4_07745 [Solirubrobacteraceae bacterium]